MDEGQGAKCRQFQGQGSRLRNSHHCITFHMLGLLSMSRPPRRIS